MMRLRSKSITFICSLRFLYFAHLSYYIVIYPATSIKLTKRSIFACHTPNLVCIYLKCTFITHTVSCLPEIVDNNFDGQTVGIILRDIFYVFEISNISEKRSVTNWVQFDALVIFDHLKVTSKHSGGSTSEPSGDH